MGGYGDQTFLLAAGVATGVAAFGYGFVLWRRKRLIEDTPTSRVRSMPMGRVELHGRAQEKAELVAPITGTACVYYRYEVEEYRRRGRHSRWVTVESGNSAAWPFYLEDETGRVLIDPRDATIALGHDYRQTDPVFGGALQTFVDRRGPERRSWFHGRRRLRFTEWRVAPGDALYVLGFAQERPGIATERRMRIAEKLKALKSDAESMAHLDTDGDQQLSADEWEVARQLANEQVRQEGVEDRIIVGKSPTLKAPFYISDKDEKTVLGRLRWQVAAGIYGGASLAVVCLGFLLDHIGILGGP